MDGYGFVMCTSFLFSSRHGEDIHLDGSTMKNNSFSYFYATATVESTRAFSLMHGIKTAPPSKVFFFIRTHQQHEVLLMATNHDAHKWPSVLCPLQRYLQIYVQKLNIIIRSVRHSQRSRHW